MRYKTLFRLLLKLLGVWLFAQSITSLARVAIWMISGVFAPASRGGPYWYLLGECMVSIVQLIVGAYLFFGGRWVADKAIPSNRPYCHECGYELTGNTSDRCPECGTPAIQKKSVS